MRVGELLANGRTSEVYAFGNDSVVKVPRPGVPAEWAGLEARFTEAVRRIGAPAPIVLEMVEIEGRESIVFERIEGISMWQRMIDAPGDAPSLSAEFAAIHREIQRLGVPEEVPDLVSRICSKINSVTQLSAAERREACNLVSGLPRGAALLHGDFHPGNVLLGQSGPVVIDWFDAAVGHPVADVVRTSILMRQHSGGAEILHLPGASTELLMSILRAYIHGFDNVLQNGRQSLGDWEAVIAASRLAEGVHTDELGLLELWSGRAAGASAAIVDLLSAVLGPADDPQELIEQIG